MFFVVSFSFFFHFIIELQGTIITLLIGLLLVAWGLVTIVVPIYDFVLMERLRMQPGLPPFQEWVKPSPEVRLNVYIFSVENPDAFLNGTDEKLRLIEIGPIVYQEHLHHQNIEFHENSTLSYTANRRLEFLEDQNEPGILDRIILVPNFVLLVTKIQCQYNATLFNSKLLMLRINRTSNYRESTVLRMEENSY